MELAIETVAVEHQEIHRVVLEEGHLEKHWVAQEEPDGEVHLEYQAGL